MPKKATLLPMNLYSGHEEVRAVTGLVNPLVTCLQLTKCSWSAWRSHPCCPLHHGLWTWSGKSSDRSGESAGDARISLVAYKAFMICLKKPLLSCCTLYFGHEVVRVATGPVNLALTPVGDSLKSISRHQHSFLGLLQVLQKDQRQLHQLLKQPMTEE